MVLHSVFLAQKSHRISIKNMLNFYARLKLNLLNFISSEKSFHSQKKNNFPVLVFVEKTDSFNAKIIIIRRLASF